MSHRRGIGCAPSTILTWILRNLYAAELARHGNVTPLTVVSKMGTEACRSTISDLDATLKRGRTEQGRHFQTAEHLCRYLSGRPKVLDVNLCRKKTAVD